MPVKSKQAAVRPCVLGAVTTGFLIGSAGCAAGRNDTVRGPWLEFVALSNITGYVDTSRVWVEPSDSSRIVWLRFDHNPPLTIKSQPGKKFSRTDMKERIDCRRARGMDIVVLPYDSAGKRTPDQPAGSRWETFDEHPYGWLFRVMCPALSTGVWRYMPRHIQEGA